MSVIVFARDVGATGLRRTVLDRRGVGDGRAGRGVGDDLLVGDDDRSPTSSPRVPPLGAPAALGALYGREQVVLAGIADPTVTPLHVQRAGGHAGIRHHRRR